MESKKQSSINWLIEQIIKEKGLVDLDIEQAKELHRQEIIDALHYFGIENAGQYYNETFK